MAGRRDDRRVEFTKMLLRESLAGIMRSKPIAKITIKEICEKAELNRGTFYAHFTDQFDLLHHTEDVEIDFVSKYVLKITSSQAEAREKVCAELFSHIREKAGVWGSLLSENGNAELSQRMFDKLFADVCSTGACMPDDPNAKLAFTFLLVGCVGMASRWLAEEPGVSAEKMGKMLSAVLAGGILEA